MPGSSTDFSTGGFKTIYASVDIYPYLCPRTTGSDDHYYYTESETRRPLLESVTPDSENGSYCKGTKLYHYENVTPRKGRELSQIELPIPYDRTSILFNSDKDIVPRYIVLVYAQETIYGWIDRIEPVATKGPETNSIVTWHVDWWMVYQHRRLINPAWLTLTGRVKRGPSQIKRPEPSEPRKWVYGNKYDLARYSSFGASYTVCLYTKKNGETSTVLKLATWEFAAIGSIQISQVYSGMTEEFLGIDPNAIIGIWFSPIKPFNFTAADQQTHTYDGHEYKWYEIDAGDVTSLNWQYHLTVDLGTILQTDDYSKYIVIDPLGTIYATLAWGLKFRYIRMNIDVGSTGACLILQFFETPESGSSDYGYSQSGEGRTVKMPLIQAPVTSNDFSSYVYSGQREYDIRMAEIQQNQNAANGIAGIGSNALMGAMAGSIVPGIGTAAGAAAGIITGAVGTTAGYFITGESDKKAQAATDKLMSNQTSNVIVNSGGPNWQRDIITHGMWLLVNMTGDTDSINALNNEHNELGYVTDYYAQDLESMIRQYAGPFRSEDVRINGVFPEEGKNYLRQLLMSNITYEKMGS